jgi:septal ring factor EnvC (AmiA/AmiB activator)
MCKKTSICLFLFFWSALLFLPLCLYSQDANQRQYYITETQLQSIEKSVEKLETDRRSWELQARELKSEAENSNAQLRQERERYGTLEKSFNRLEDSRSMENQEKDNQILKLTQDNAEQMKWIFILGGIICLFIIVLTAVLVIKIKTGGISALLKKLAFN